MTEIICLTLSPLTRVATACAELKVCTESKLTLLLLRPLSIGPHVVVALNHKIIFMLLHKL